MPLLVLVFGAKCRSRLDLRGGGTKKAPKHYQNPSIKLRSRPKSAFHRSCTGMPRSFAPETSTSFWCEMSIKARFARRWNQKGSKTLPKSLHKAAITPKIGFPPLLYGYASEFRTRN